METQTIKEIKNLRDNIREELKDIDRSTYSETFGSESEYSGKGIYLGIDSLLIDISYLVKAHNQFIKISTREERVNIKSLLTSISSNLSSPSNLLIYTDQLKVILRNFHIGEKKERWELFQEINRDLLLQRDEFSEVLSTVKEKEAEIISTKEKIDKKLDEFSTKYVEIEEKIAEIETTKDEIVENSESLELINSKLSKIKDDADSHLIDISESLTSAKGNEKIIDSFAQKIQDRDNRLVELQLITEENKKKLAEYEDERKSIISEAEKLIENAKTALNYSTASGLSESFQTQHTNAVKWQFSMLWIVGAVVFIVIAISLGVWITFDKIDDTHLVLGRVAIIPLPILAAIFCSNQYVKQKNLIEDYAYKTVLAKSIVGFSEQLKKDASEDKGEFIHYIKVALEEIHKDPLRKRNTKVSENKALEKVENFALKDVLDMVERISKINKN